MRTVALKLGLALGLLCAGFVGQAQAADSASIKLSIIKASKKPGPTDPALRGISRKLKSAFSGHKSFKQLAKHKFDLQLKKTRQIKLPNGQTASFTYLGQKKKTHRFKVSIPRSKVNMTVSMKSRQLFFIARRNLKHQDGDMVFAIYLR